jgi:bifunctional enzyme CysN/CysC
MCPAARGKEQEQARTPQPLRERERGHLRLLTCGSVDDGKSTLIGRLLYDAKLLFEDHERALARDSRRY